VRRSDQRHAAVVALYQSDLTGKSLTDTLGRNAPLFTRALAHAAADHAEDLDLVIERHSHGWSVSRIAPLERNIMRVALVEMLYPELAPSDTPIPAEGAIDEAVQSAKVYCGVDAPGFVNGVLAAALRAVRENDAAGEDGGTDSGQPALHEAGVGESSSDSDTTPRP
jgi:N utilization substance protein B